MLGAHANTLDFTKTAQTFIHSCSCTVRNASICSALDQSTYGRWSLHCSCFHRLNKDTCTTVLLADFSKLLHSMALDLVPEVSNYVKYMHKSKYSDERDRHCTYSVTHNVMKMESLISSLSTHAEGCTCLMTLTVRVTPCGMYGYVILMMHVLNVHLAS